MKINRFGTFHGAPYRYINFCKNNPEISINWFHLQGDVMIEELKKLVETNELQNIRFFSVSSRISKKIKMAQRVALVTRRLGIFQNKLGQSLFKLGLSLLIARDKNLNSILSDSADLSWCGSNDVDFSLTFLIWLKLKWPDLDLVYSYKEHRCSFRIDEGLALDMASTLILPTESSMLELNKVYDLDLSVKTKYADEDWRSASIGQYVKSAKVSKYSSVDSCPHVIILTRYAEYGNSIDPRRGSRINFLRIIQTFASNGVKVHLKSMCICENIGGICHHNSTPYHKLATDFPEHVFIEDPIKLNLDSDYLELAKFDYGILHNYEEGELTNAFSRINIPNRLYEYFVSDVRPIVLENTLEEVENIIRDIEFGLIVKNYKEAADKMKEQVTHKRVISHSHAFNSSFETFMETLINSD